ncbi:MAG: DUF2284 domain-containing protein [Clostridiales bacterium]|nr:DUF2284 domain-containing protein [Clostridiales bacterium]
MSKRTELERRLAEFPLVEYGFLRSDQVEFLDRVRTICREQCPRYGTSWACPPAVGTVEECRDRCMKFNKVLIFTTMAEVSDITNLEETLATRKGHEEISRQVEQVLKELFGDCLVLSTESCSICKECTYPNGPCRHPEQMYPCVESYGILVTALAEQAGMAFLEDYNMVLWFSAAFFQDEETGK